MDFFDIILYNLIMGTLLIEFIKQSQKTYDNATPQTFSIQNPPHIFFLGCLMDKQIDWERAFQIPYRIAAEEFKGNLDFANFENQSEQWYIDVFEKYKLHRYNKNQSKFFYAAIQKIKNEYGGNIESLWDGKQSSDGLVYRFLQFRGVGPKIASMIANILVREYKIELSDYKMIDISADVHVRRVFYRLGLIDDENSVQKTIDKAREINPKFPGLPDLFCWKLGNSGICSTKKCKNNDCPLSEYCAKIGLPR